MTGGRRKGVDRAASAWSRVSVERGLGRQWSVASGVFCSVLRRVNTEVDLSFLSPPLAIPCRQRMDFPLEGLGESGLSSLRLGSSLANGGEEEVGKGEDKGVPGSW